MVSQIFPINFTLNDFIKTNIIVRMNELENPCPKQHEINSRCVELIDIIESDSNYDILNMLKFNQDIFCRISSKSIGYKNRLEGLNFMLKGQNFQSTKIYEQFEQLNKYKFLVVCYYIVVGQVFSNGNHRVGIEFLMSNHIDKLNATNIVNIMDISRNVNQIGWENIHDFIQIIIFKLVKMINEKINFMEKIENIFV